MSGGAMFRVREFLNSALGRVVVIGALVLILAGGAFRILRDSTQIEADQIRAQGRNVLYYCSTCGAGGEIHVAFDATFPMDCPKPGCDGKAVRAFRCANPKCRQIIAAEDRPVYSCPHCGYVYDNRLTPAGPYGGG